MKLYKKALLITGIVIIGLILVLYAASEIILMNSFSALEIQYSQQNVERAVNTIDEDISKLDHTSDDWSGWDDTYAFIEDANENYITSNLVNGTFTSNELNFIVFMNSSGGIVYGRGFDLANSQEIPVPPGLLEKISRNDILLQHPDINSSHSGLLLLPEGPILISSRPIRTSDLKGPIRGTLIMGRYLNKAKIMELSGITQLPLTIIPYDEQQMPSDFQIARSSLSADMPVFARPLGQDMIAGYAMLNDIYGNPALVLRADMPRNIYDQGKVTTNYFFASVLLIGLFFGGTAVLLLKRSVLSPMAVLSKNVSEIGKSRNLSLRVKTAGDDELQNLACDINKMLGSLEESRKELQKSEEKNRALVNAIPDLLFQLAKDGTILNYNAIKNSQQRDLPPGFSGKNIYELIPAEMNQISASYLYRALETGNLQIFEFGIYMNGSNYDYEARFVANGKDEVIAIVRNITERKRAEETLKQTMENLAQTNIELEQFAHLAAHDLQEPLRMVTKYLQLLEIQYKGKVDQNAYEYIAFAAYGARRLQSMLDHMLQYSRINTRGRPFEMTDCNTALNSALTDMKATLDESRAIITHDPLPVVFGDPSQLSELFQNLVGNAIKFMLDNPPQIHVGLDKKENEFVFSVKDNGIGFDMKQSYRLFKMFQRLHGEKYPGIGMGLAICRKIIERHGGRIWAESEVGKGSTFYFTLPVR